MAPTTASVALVAVGVGAALAYRMLVARLRGLAWEEAKREPASSNSALPDAHPFAHRREMPFESTTSNGVRWTFCGPECSPMQSLHHQVLCVPAYMCRLATLPFALVPVIVRVGLFRITGRETWLCATDECMFDMMTSTSAIIHCNIDQNDGADKLVLVVPTRLMPERHRAEVGPDGLRVVFDVATKLILEVTPHVKRLELCSIFVTLTIAAHSLLHRSGESCAREIAAKGLLVLEPSSRFVVSLHTGLIHGATSPMKHTRRPKRRSASLIDTETDITTIWESAGVAVHPHKYDKALLQFRFYRFVAEARPIVRVLLAKYALDINAESFLHNACMHYLDHHNLYNCTQSSGVIWSYSASNSTWSYVVSNIWKHVWLQPLHWEFLEEHRLNRLGARGGEGGAFYSELHAAIAKIDPEYARVIRVSCSF
ncbi:hypothetical protein T492DRAFT_1004845 [Pavlovales sp. CCMP2436]|nr:hypothetical protein T492DRAFT_1004845 [Pavlovales sp. CCMP2436]